MSPTTQDTPLTVTHWMPEPLRLSQMVPHPLNPNVETDEKFKKLIESLQEDGPDQAIVVAPLLDDQGRLVQTDPPKFTIIKGMHRWKAAQQLGWDVFPTVVRTDWTDEVTQLTRLIKDNVVRGAADGEKLTAAIRHLETRHQLDRDLAAVLTGFDDAEDLMAHMVFAGKKADEQAAADADAAATKTPIIEDLTTMVNALLAEHGHTLLPHGYIAFPFGGKLNYLVPMTPELEAQMRRVAAVSGDRKVDVNLILADLINDHIVTLEGYR